MTLSAYDEHAAICLDNDMPRWCASWLHSFVSDAWQYTRHTYGGDHGPDPRLYSVHHGRYVAGHVGYHFLPAYGDRNWTTWHAPRSGGCPNGRNSVNGPVPNVPRARLASAASPEPMDGSPMPLGGGESVPPKADLAALFQSGYVTGCLYAVSQIERHAKAGRIDLVVQTCIALREETTGTPTPAAEANPLRRTA